MMCRGALKEGVHYFKLGPRGRPIFKWAAVEALIEGKEPAEPSGNTIRMANGAVVDLDEEAAHIRRLRG